MKSKIIFLHKMTTDFSHIYISFKDNQSINHRRLKYWKFVIDLGQSQFDEVSKIWLNKKTTIKDFLLQKMREKSLAQQVPYAFLSSKLFSRRRHKDKKIVMIKSWKVNGSRVGSKPEPTQLSSMFGKRFFRASLEKGVGLGS